MSHRNAASSREVFDDALGICDAELHSSTRQDIRRRAPRRVQKPERMECHETLPLLRQVRTCWGGAQAPGSNGGRIRRKNLENRFPVTKQNSIGQCRCGRHSATPPRHTQKFKPGKFPGNQDAQQKIFCKRIFCLRGGTCTCHIIELIATSASTNVL